MSERGEIQIGDDARELLVLQALRALLGDNRAQTALVNLQNKNAALSKEIMAEAQARYDEFTLNNKEDINKALIQVSMSSTKLRLKLLMKQGPRGILLSLVSLPRFAIRFLLLIPRLMKRLFLK